MTETSSQKDISVIVPCYNEEEVLSIFHQRLSAVMQKIGMSWEVVYVNDGSRDQTLTAMNVLANRDKHVSIVNLSRNFGKEIALTAGLDHARGTRGVIVIDADLQDPPEVIADLVAAWNADVDTVYAQRNTREGESALKKLTAWMFYRLIKRLGNKVVIPPDTGDFRLVSRRLVDNLLLLRERHRFMKGLFAWVGFPTRAVLYDRAPRTGGKSSFNYWSLWNFALEGITSFSVLPLQIGTYMGLIISILSVLYGFWIVARTLLFGNPVAGYPSLMAVILFMGGVQLMTIGIIGEYVGRIFNETKNRPLYLVEKYQPASE
ncbi:glycosyl transferase family 2 [Gluconobacter japonicus]|uniref:Glycosyltransferase family 2 protein n=1 Tax=Gluconobacter japonicus TaxID=376620 RepID=A0A9Q2FIW4_GLUJA|nr:glycosyltransferase family 2 protein [Gluconobacter japonicus]KXV39892.1 glycosyl transferase family 2 [Gluconobacter japonicus]KXV41697.1 glycosyl transferase family 2 [Gluconobacter japonicus]MBF0869896.1 glycosyltransferase family 2 protein [Gluconobacter japonicus]